MRRFQGLGLIILLLVLALIEYYSFSAVRFATRQMRPSYRYTIFAVYFIITAAWLSMFLFLPAMRNAEVSRGLRNFVISFAMAILIAKVMTALILFLDDARRVIFHITALVYGNVQVPKMVQSGMTRSDFINKLALLAGGTMLGAIFYGMGNRYKYTLRNIRLAFSNLPASFKGLRVVQISDIHSGSFTSLAAVQKGIDLVMAQKPDVIFFTGDLVNNKSEEMMEYISLFSSLKAPLGVYSILGNHDYGDYAQWESMDAKRENLEMLKQIHARMGWRLLLNEHVTLERNGEQIAVIGVENTSFKNRFHTYGDMSRAYAGSEAYSFKILLSHDPSHWDGEVNSKYKDVDLTLSGHTHGFQFGVEIPWLKWSPIQYIYKQWAGIYRKEQQYLYVNRGFGFIGYPGRVGILPEVTLIELS